MFKHSNLQIFISNYTNMSNFHPYEVVSRGGETQLQVGENFNYITSALRNKYIVVLLYFQSEHFPMMVKHI